MAFWIDWSSGGESDEKFVETVMSERRRVVHVDVTVKLHLFRGLLRRSLAFRLKDFDAVGCRLLELIIVVAVRN